MGPRPLSPSQRLYLGPRTFRGTSGSLHRAMLMAAPLYGCPWAHLTQGNE